MHSKHYKHLFLTWPRASLPQKFLCDGGLIYTYLPFLSGVRQQSEELSCAVHLLVSVDVLLVGVFVVFFLRLYFTSELLILLQLLQARTCRLVEHVLALGVTYVRVALAGVHLVVSRVVGQVGRTGAVVNLAEAAAQSCQNLLLAGVAHASTEHLTNLVLIDGLALIVELEFVFGAAHPENFESVYLGHEL